MSTDVNNMAEAASSSSRKQKTSKQHCCVPLCNSNSSYDSSLSFHHFPSGKNENRRKQWLIKIRRDEGPLFKVSLLFTMLKYIIIIKLVQTFHIYSFIPTYCHNSYKFQ